MIDLKSLHISGVYIHFYGLDTPRGPGRQTTEERSRSLPDRIGTADESQLNVLTTTERK